MKTIILAAAALAASSIAALCGDAFSLGGSNGTLSSVVVPAQPFSKIRVQLVSGTSDKAASEFKFYRANATATVNATVGTNQTIVTGPGNGTFSAQDVVAIYSVASNAGARAVVQSANATSITLSANATIALASGDKVYRMSAAGSLPCGNTTVTISGATLFHASGSPVLIDLDGTSACKLNLVSGEYF